MSTAFRNDAPSSPSGAMMMTTPTLVAASLTWTPVESTGTPTGYGTADSQPAQDYGSKQVNPLRIVLDCVFALAAMALIAGFFFWRYMMIRRARRPLRHFFRAETYDPDATTNPQYSNVYLPMPSVRIPPPLHTHGRYDRVERPSGDPEWLPAYDDKDMPPKYQEATAKKPVSPRPNDDTHTLPTLAQDQS